MLKQRILTALILAPVAIACLFFLPPLGFAIFVGLVVTVGAWEWANFANISPMGRYGYAALVAVLLLASYFVPSVFILAAGGLWWIGSFFLMRKYPQATDLWAGKLAISLIGLVVLVPGFVSLLLLKSTANANFLILLLFFLIWGADIGAYFTGRAFGKHKLAPLVSPGKTWEGFYGGLVIAFGIGVAMLLWLDKPDLTEARGWLFLAGIVLVIMVSVLGDLVMSMFKRNRGVKDSSHLLPGHGGFLDRIDSLLSAGPVFALLILLIGWT
jgi:phosphatidate cytidylyltransferase